MQFPALLPLGRQAVLVLVSPDDQVQEVVQELHRDVALGAVSGAVLVQHEHVEPALRVFFRSQHQKLEKERRAVKKDRRLGRKGDLRTGNRREQHCSVMNGEHECWSEACIITLFLMKLVLFIQYQVMLDQQPIRLKNNASKLTKYNRTTKNVP